MFNELGSLLFEREVAESVFLSRELVKMPLVSIETSTVSLYTGSAMPLKGVYSINRGDLVQTRMTGQLETAGGPISKNDSLP